jgi:hypothetical protein
MHARKPSLLRLFGIGIAVVALAMLATAPVRAAGSDDYKGWYLTLDAALTQPTSLDQHYANHVTFGTPPNMDRLVLDNDTDFTGLLKVGYGFGKGMGALQISYWGFDNEDSISKTFNGGVYPTIFGYGDYGGMYLYDASIKAKAKTQATLLDVDYLRSYGVGEKTQVTWLAGVRSAKYEETRDFYGDDGSIYTQHKHFKSTGIGLKLGAMVHFGFTEHFGLDGSTTFSFLQADTKGDSNQNFVTFDEFETAHGEDNNVRGEIRDYDLKACWNYGKLSYFVGYAMSNWDGMPTDPVPPNEGGHQALGPEAPRGRNSVGFNSFHAGVTIKFGGGK